MHAHLHHNQPTKEEEDNQDVSDIPPFLAKEEHDGNA